MTDMPVTYYKFLNSLVDKYPVLDVHQTKRILPDVRVCIQSVEYFEEFLTLEHKDFMSFFFKVLRFGQEQFVRETYKPCLLEPDCNATASAGALCTCSVNKELSIDLNLVDSILLKKEQKEKRDDYEREVLRIVKERKIKEYKYLLEIAKLCDAFDFSNHASVVRIFVRETC